MVLSWYYISIWNSPVYPAIHSEKPLDVSITCGHRDIWENNNKKNKKKQKKKIQSMYYYYIVNSHVYITTS